MASLNSFLPACAMARVRWLGLFLLLLHVLPSLSDFASWERRRELDKKREKVSRAREDKERTEERISQAEAKLASLPPWTPTCGQCLPFPNNATGLKVLASYFSKACLTSKTVLITNNALPQRCQEWSSSAAGQLTLPSHSPVMMVSVRNQSCKMSIFTQNLPTQFHPQKFYTDIICDAFCNTARNPPNGQPAGRPAPPSGGTLLCQASSWRGAAGKGEFKTIGADIVIVSYFFRLRWRVADTFPDLFPSRCDSWTDLGGKIIQNPLTFSILHNATMLNPFSLYRPNGRIPVCYHGG